MDAFAGFPVIKLELLEPYEMGRRIGSQFSSMVQSRIERDPHLKNELLPFAATCKGQELVEQLKATNKDRYPRYWDELRGIADGAGVPFLEVLLLNLRKEISPFLSKEAAMSNARASDECSDVLLSRSDLALIAHNEDAHVSVDGHTFLVHARLSSGVTFVAYTYAGELPTCAFGFNSFGVAFTLNAVPLDPDEVVAGGIGRNFVSRDLLESRNMSDALHRLQMPLLSSGHNYNLMDLNMKRIFNVETASQGRYSVLEITDVPYFHANMYLRLQVRQVTNQSSVHREHRAAQMKMASLEDILSVLGDDADSEYPIYMSGPSLCTLCTVLFDLNARKMRVYRGKPSTSGQCFETFLDNL